MKHSINFEFEKQTDENFITQNFRHVSYFEEKEIVKTMPKGGYI